MMDLVCQSVVIVVNRANLMVLVPRVLCFSHQKRRKNVKLLAFLGVLMVGFSVFGCSIRVYTYHVHMGEKARIDLGLGLDKDLRVETQGQLPIAVGQTAHSAGGGTMTQTPETETQSKGELK
jgi:hypothetical protein